MDKMAMLVRLLLMPWVIRATMERMIRVIELSYHAQINKPIVSQGRCVEFRLKSARLRAVSQRSKVQHVNRFPINCSFRFQESLDKAISKRIKWCLRQIRTLVYDWNERERAVIDDIDLPVTLRKYHNESISCEMGWILEPQSLSGRDC